MRSNHIAILNSFKIIAIKFKVTKRVVAQIDWKIIGHHNLTNELFKNRLSKSISGGDTYSNYKNHILEADTNTSTINNQKKKLVLFQTRLSTSLDQRKGRTDI